MLPTLHESLKNRAVLYLEERGYLVKKEYEIKADHLFIYPTCPYTKMKIRVDVIGFKSGHPPLVIEIGNFGKGPCTKCTPNRVYFLKKYGYEFEHWSYKTEIHPEDKLECTRCKTKFSFYQAYNTDRCNDCSKLK